MQFVDDDKGEEKEPFYQEVILWQSWYEGRFDSLKKIETLSRPPVGETWQSMSVFQNILQLFIPLSPFLPFVF